MSNFELPETPFQQIRAELTYMQNQYWKLEHITRGVSKALGNCGSGNILREVARVTDRSKMKALKMEKAQLIAQVVAMMQELTQNSKEIWKYQTKQVVVLN